jgi:hypothetical protein
MAFLIVLAFILAVALLAPFIGADSRNLSTAHHYPQWPGTPDLPAAASNGPLALGLALDSVRTVPAPRSPADRAQELIS